MVRTVVIGYGSELRGDDRLGPLAARQLAAEISDPDVRVLERPSLTPELAGELAEAEWVVFIDCSQSGPIGEVVVREIEPPNAHAAALVHFLDPAALVGWTHLVYGRAPRGLVVTTAGCTFEFADQLSPPLEAALPRVVERVRGLLLPAATGRQ